jgi:hypothetical protein
MMTTHLSLLKWTDSKESTGIFIMNLKYDLVTFAKKLVLFFLVLIGTIIPAYSLPADSLTQAQKDTLIKNASPMPDSLVPKDTATIKSVTAKAPDTSKNSVNPGTAGKSVQNPITTAPSNSDTSDTTIDINGRFIGLRAGWTIGNFDLVRNWQEALLDSLGDFNLNKSSFRVVDTTHTSPYIDTTDLRYNIKELPGEYNISIPIGLQYTKISEQKKTSVLLSFAYVGKTQKSVITGAIDSLSESVNIRSNLKTFSFSLEGNYSIPFPDQYFKIDGIDKSFFTIGISFSSILVRVGNDISFGGKSSRMDSVKSSISNILADKSSLGAAVSLRAGISTIKALSKTSILEFGVSYFLSRYDYFYKDSNRLNKGWIQPGVKDSDKPLAFFSNRIEFSVGVFRRVPK